MNATELKYHDENVHRHIYFSCKSCDFVPTVSEALEDHIQISHEKDNQHYFKCDFCTYSPFSKHDLTRHMRVMHKDRQESLVFNRSKGSYPLKPVNATKFPAKTQHTRKEIYRTKSTEPSSYVEDHSGGTTYYCDKSCTRLHNSFTHKDELELHLRYYHDEDEQ